MNTIHEKCKNIYSKWFICLKNIYNAHLSNHSINMYNINVKKIDNKNIIKVITYNI